MAFLECFRLPCTALLFKTFRDHNLRQPVDKPVDCVYKFMNIQSFLLLW